MNTYRIALYPGDGIGVDVVHEATKVLRAVEHLSEFQISMNEYDWGHRYWSATGQVAPDDFL